MSKKDIFNNWFKEHKIEDVEVLLPDMAGAARGKIIPATSFGEGEMKMPEPEVTGLIWADTMDGDWAINWPKTHNVVSAPSITTNPLKMHSWDANAWVARREMESVNLGFNGWKKVNWPHPPIANNLIMTGLITTVGGVPIDLGLPGWINFKAIEKAKLLDL